MYNIYNKYNIIYIYIYIYIYIIHIYNTYFKFLACIGYFVLFINIEKGYGTSLWCRFYVYFFHKNVSY